ncbi:5081_t:CDS:2 [Funneliformis geosporum]|uniref:5081_t:CDS:1 n=1 Tax=Funneliformis geosporum TaxID=1117311 RepID=A0A9W4SMB0_9GLOM|nr:5081_t:CDS:2 [Funneliformis geosporum]
MNTPTTTDVQIKLRALVDMILGYLKDINNVPTVQSSENVDVEVIVNDLGKLGMILADNATKVTIACKPTCTPISAVPTIKAMGDTLFRICGFVESIPISAGKTLIKKIRSTTKEILFDSTALVNSFLDEPVDPNPDTIISKGYLISTGIIWEACDRFENLPKNNKQAVTIQWKEMLELLKDANLEVKHLIDNDENQGFEDDGWDEIFEGSNNSTLTAKEKEIVELSLKLLNLVKILFTKVLKRCIEPLDISSSKNGLSKINQTLDQYMDLGKLIADAADELGTSLYPPQNSAAIETNVNHLSLRSQDLIKVILPFASEEEVKWFNTCDAQFTKILKSIMEKNKA